MYASFSVHSSKKRVRCASGGSAKNAARSLAEKCDAAMPSRSLLRALLDVDSRIGRARDHARDDAARVRQIEAQRRPRIARVDFRAAVRVRAEPPLLGRDGIDVRGQHGAAQRARHEVLELQMIECEAPEPLALLGAQQRAIALAQRGRVARGGARIPHVCVAFAERRHGRCVRRRQGRRGVRHSVCHVVRERLARVFGFKLTPTFAIGFAFAMSAPRPRAGSARSPARPSCRSRGAGRAAQPAMPGASARAARRRQARATAAPPCAGASLIGKCSSAANSPASAVAPQISEYDPVASNT